MSRLPNKIFWFLHPEGLHHLVTQVIDDLHGNAASFGSVEGAGGVTVEGSPGVCIYLGFESGLESFIGIISAEEIGMADEKAAPHTNLCMRGGAGKLPMQW